MYYNRGIRTRPAKWLTQKRFILSGLARLPTGREASETGATETARRDTAQREGERRLSSGPTKSIACYSLHRLVGNLRRTERITYDFRHLSRQLDRAEDGFLVDSLQKCLMPGISPYWRLVSRDCVRHQEVAANRPGFPAPTIPRLFGALARESPRRGRIGSPVEYSLHTGGVAGSIPASPTRQWQPIVPALWRRRF